MGHLHLPNKDLRNIEMAFQLRSAETHQSDAISVGIVADEVKAKPESNPTLLYKPQGQTVESGFGANDLF